MRTIYIAGPMKYVPDYRVRFNAAESYLIMKGWRVLNPACLPDGLREDAYMPICLAMVSAADAAVPLIDWKNSRGAEIELKYAEYQGKPVYTSLESVPALTEDSP